MLRAIVFFFFAVSMSSFGDTYLEEVSGWYEELLVGEWDQVQQWTVSQITEADTGLVGDVTPVSFIADGTGTYGHIRILWRVSDGNVLRIQGFGVSKTYWLKSIGKDAVVYVYEYKLGRTPAGGELSWDMIGGEMVKYYEIGVMRRIVPVSE